MQKNSSSIYNNMVCNKYIMLTILTFSILLIFTISILNHVKADSFNDYNKKFISIEIHTGDTLTSIANEYSQSFDYEEYINEVKSINNLKNDTIHSGCYLIIPIYEK